MERATESIATNDTLSLFKTTPGLKNVGVWVKAVFDFITTTTSNKSCEHQYDGNNNTTNIYTAPKYSKVGVCVKVKMDFVATKDCLSLFQRRNRSFNYKIDHLNNSNNNISELFFADTNTFPSNNITSESTNFIIRQIFETNNIHNVFGRITGDDTTTTTTTTNGNNHEFDVSGNVSEVKRYSFVTMEIMSLSKRRSEVNDRNIKK